MERKYIWISLVAVALSFVGGFLLANSINRGEITILRGENERLKTTGQPDQGNGDDLTLSNQEIEQKLAEAEQNAGNFQYQRNLGLALYRYSAMKQDPELVDKAIPVLERANTLNSSDHDVIVGLANAYFDKGYLRKDNASFETSRTFYAKALAQKPNDKEVRTDLGLTYFLYQPPDYTAAADNFKQSLKIDPKHEKSLQFLIQALVKNGRNEEASKYFATLRSINPSNPTLQEFASLLAEISNSQKQ